MENSMMNPRYCPFCNKEIEFDGTCGCEQSVADYCIYCKGGGNSYIQIGEDDVELEICEECNGTGKMGGL
jgi:hypothetical protein